MINDIVQLLGIANPQLSKAWTNRGSTTATTLPILGADKFTYTCDAGDEWLAPVGGILTENQHHKLLQLPDGGTPSTGIVLQLAPQVFLALKRLYATIIEGQTNTDVTARPVPKYFLYSNNTKLPSGDPNPGPQPGFYTAGSALRLTGKMTIHDEEGIAIDPLAVANALDSFMQAHASLEIKALDTTSATVQSARQTFQIANSLVVIAGTTERRIYFTDIFNAPSNSGALTNVSVIAGSVYQLTTAGTPVSGADNLFQLSLSTTGTFANTLNYPTAAITLIHDFIRVKTVGWRTHLLGDPRDNEATAAKGVLPELRDNELISFCFSGNECLAQIGKITSGTGAEKTLVSPDIREDVDLPPPPDGTGNHLWPAFAQGKATSTAPIDPNLKNTLATVAHFITDTATNNTDVYFQLTSIPPAPPLTNGLAIRVFHRVFHSDGTETRSDGAGTIVFNNTAAFRLKDPLGINRPFTPGITLPTNPKLIVDMVVINALTPKVQSRRFGNIITKFSNIPAPLSALEQSFLLPGSNNFAAITNRGIATSGFLGVKTSPNPVSLIGDVNTFILASGTDVGIQPCKSPMLPTQSRLESIAAAKTGIGADPEWSAFIGGLRMSKESRENFLNIGNPGSPGGSDTHSTGLVTAGGRLAYDIGRAGLRRSRHLSERIKALISNPNYSLPPLPGAAGRNFISAMLQNIGKKTDSPRLAQFQEALTNLPATTQVFADQLNGVVQNDTKPPWLPEALKSQFKTALTGIAISADKCQVALEELNREYVNSISGRKDSVTALTRAINNARQFIYMESSFFSPTQYPGSAAGEIPVGDLVDVINKRLDARPGLKVILCLAQDIPFNRGYDNIAKFHLANRNRSVLRLLGTKNETTQRYARENQVVAFHPLGFPGRPIKINTQCVIIDDVWAMMGSSNFSQRGFFFDGSTDIVFCDKQVQNGKSLSIQNLRRSLMEQYLRMDNPSATIPDSKRVFLQSGRAAFELFRSLIDSGGGAMIREFVPVELTGIEAPELTALQNLADPNGDSFYQAQGVLNTWLAALSTVPE